LDPFPPALTRPSGENRPLSSSARVTSTPLRPVAPATRTVSRSGSCAPHGGTIAEHAAVAPTWPRNSRRELCLSLVVSSFLLPVGAWNKGKRSVSRVTLPVAGVFVVSTYSLGLEQEKTLRQQGGICGRVARHAARLRPRKSLAASSARRDSTPRLSHPGHIAWM
jgi:hypothetical protein